MGVPYREPDDAGLVRAAKELDAREALARRADAGRACALARSAAGPAAVRGRRRGNAVKRA